MAISLPLSSDDAIRRTIQQMPAGFWDFASADTKEWTHGYHSYPAMMIPQIARIFIQVIKQNRPDIGTLFDPFMGSGTSLVEGLLAGLSVTGSDLNPLSRLLAFTKTTAWDPDVLQCWMDAVASHIGALTVSEADWPTFDHLTFWFKPVVIADLSRLKRSIATVVPAPVQPFFWVAFSDTVRWVSNSRNAEFKLYRLDAPRLAQWNPDVLAVFRRVMARNQLGNARLWSRQPLPPASLRAFNAMDLSALPADHFDIMVTSPPYGDSRTTVAYGQFSRLSLQWLDLEDGANSPAPNRLDQALLGGQAAKSPAAILPSPTLQAALTQIAARDAVRAAQVLAFYQDLDRALSEISRVMRPDSYQCWVVGNRTVKKIQLLTDRIIIELGARYGLVPVTTVTRTIPNKRMPKENSPTNQPGDKMTTMNGEQLFILRKMP